LTGLAVPAALRRRRFTGFAAPAALRRRRRLAGAFFAVALRRRRLTGAFFAAALRRRRLTGVFFAAALRRRFAGFRAVDLRVVRRRVVVRRFAGLRAVFLADFRAVRLFAGGTVTTFRRGYFGKGDRLVSSIVSTCSRRT
jgi:hypothetical protein